MTIHDWTLVEDGIIHAFHTTWMGALQNSFNDGLLPKGYYALAEQHAGRYITDVLTLHASPEPWEAPILPPATGGVALAEAPPRLRLKQTVEPAALALRRSLAIRHVSGHRLIALLEIVSLANKDRAQRVSEFAEKAVSALERGVHLLLVDLFPPGRHDPHGMHGVVLQHLERSEEPYDLPLESPLTVASYVAGPRIDVYLEHLAVGSALPEAPLFIRPDRYVNVPLESTYQSSFRGMPSFWRDVLKGRSPEGV